MEGLTACGHEFTSDDVLISRQEQAERGWLDPQSRGVSIEGKVYSQKLFDLLNKIGSLYNTGKAKSNVKTLDITDLKVPGGGTLRVALENAEAVDFKRLQEFFQDMHNVVKVTPETDVTVEIPDPVDDCAVVKALKE